MYDKHDIQLVYCMCLPAYGHVAANNRQGNTTQLYAFTSDI